MMAIEDGGAMKKEPITMQTDTQPVDLRDWGYAPGYYSIKCRDCTEAGLRDCAAKHSWRCKDCATKAWEASLAAAKSTAAKPVDLEALRSSAKAFRDYPIYDSEGDPVYLTAQADELDAAATEIKALRAQVTVMRGALLKLEAMCIGPLTPMSEGDTRLILSPNGRDVLVTARAALGDAK